MANRDGSEPTSTPSAHRKGIRWWHLAIPLVLLLCGLDLYRQVDRMCDGYKVHPLIDVVMSPIIDCGVTRTNLARDEVKALANAARLYELKHGHLPDSLNDLVPGEVRELRQDPWQQPYMYRKGGNGRDRFEITSCGPDRKCGDDDDIRSAGVESD